LVGLFLTLVLTEGFVVSFALILSLAVPSTIDLIGVVTNAKVVRGNQLVLDCPAQGVPPPTIQWLKVSRWRIAALRRVQLMSPGLQRRFLFIMFKHYDTKRTSCWNPVWHQGTQDYYINFSY